jgi:hypothetical protein
LTKRRKATDAQREKKVSCIEIKNEIAQKVAKKEGEYDEEYKGKNVKR